MAKDIEKAQLYIEKELFPYYSSLDIDPNNSRITVKSQSTYTGGEVEIGGNTYTIHSEEDFLEATQALFEEMNLTNIHIQGDSVTANV